MAKFWRGLTASPEKTDLPYPDREPGIDLRAAVASRPTWRYRMLLLAIGSSTPDGSDVTPSDRDLLLRMDQHLMKCAQKEGDEAAQQALMALVEVLKGESNERRAQLH